MTSSASRVQATGDRARWEARRALDRLAYGPTPGEVDRVATVGARAWVAGELARPAPPVAASAPPAEPRLPRFGRGRFGGAARDSGEAMAMRRELRGEAREIGLTLLGERLKRAVAGAHPLYETMVEFWGNHFHVFARKALPETFLLPSYERDVLRRYALGRFGQLLLASASHPAMLFYLDNWRSSARRGVNENYARELLELHTLGVDGGYTQKDVEAVARAFSGWTLRRAGDGAAFYFEPRWHDFGEKVVLGRPLATGGGQRDGEAVLEMLAAHPSTARHVARKLAVRFLSDDPPERAVERTAARFRASGGDVRATLEALLLGGDELFDPAFVKVKTPFELVVSALRATGARLDRPEGTLGALRALGHLPYLAPTPAGAPDQADRWIDPGAALERVRFAFALSAGRLPGVDGSGLERIDPHALIGNEMRPSTRRALATEGLSPRERVALVLASPEFQLR